MNAASRATEWLAVALEMEGKGRAFYERASAAAVNEPAREIFRMLGQDELTHLERIREIFEELNRGKPWPAAAVQPLPHLEPVAVFRELAAKVGDKITTGGDIEALDFGIELEAKSIRFYSDLIDRSQEDLEREFLNRILDEEKGHHRALVDMKFYLQDPAGYFRETEKGGLDG